MQPLFSSEPITRRSLLQRLGTGLGVVGLAGLLQDQKALATTTNPLAPKQPHFRPKAKRIIHLFMNGGLSQVDTFDPKPALTRYNGQRPPTADRSAARATAGLGLPRSRFHPHGAPR